MVSKNRYRSRLDIIADILSSTGNAARKTRIMFGANLNFDLVNKYLTDALKAGLIAVDDGRLYFVTERGKEFLKRYDKYTGLKRMADDHANSIKVIEADLKGLCWSGMRKEGAHEARSDHPL